MYLKGFDRTAVLQHETQAVSEAVARRLRAAEAPPFIGQLPLLPEERSAAVERIRLFHDPFSALCRLFRHQAPLALALVAGEVAGQGDAAPEDHGVFPYIEHLLGKAKRVLSSADRDELVLVFREAAVRLGLTVQPERRPGDRTWRMNELVLQGGARRGHARTLAEAFLRTERAIGLPDPADTTSCVRFCRAAAERLPNTPRLRMILECDQSGWHAALFARLRHGDPAGESRIGPALQMELEGFASRPVVVARRRPELVLRGLDLCVHVPDGEPVVVDDGEREVVAPSGDLVLRAPWPTALRWRPADAPWRPAGEWLGVPDACAVFEAESGRFIGAVRPGGRLEVPPGGIAIVSRGGFCVDGQPADAILGGVRIAWATVERCESLLDFSDSASAIVAPRPDRRISLGPQVARDAGGVVLLGSSAVATVSVPGDAGARLAAQLWLRHPALPPGGLRIEVDLDEDGMAQVPVGRLLPQTGPAGRLQAVLTLPGEERALVAASAWYWPGLERFDGRRFHGPVPTNLMEEGCRGIRRTPEGIGIAGDGDRPEILLALSAGTLRFSAPGVYVALERPGVPPEAAAPLPAGTTITLGGNLAWTLRVTCDNPAAVLEVGQHVDSLAFAKAGVRRVSFGSLLGALDGGDGEVRVRYLGPADPARALCRLVRSETPTSFEIASRSDFVEVDFSMGRPLAALRLECSELLSGRATVLDLAPEDRPDRAAMTRKEKGAALFGSESSDGGSTYRLTVPFAGWDDGLWLLEPYCRAEGMPGNRPLRTAADEGYAVAFLSRGGVRERRIDALPMPDAEAAFRRAARALSNPLAKQAAAAAEPVEELYRASGRRLLEEAPRKAAAAFADDLAGVETIGSAPGVLPRLSPWHVDLAAFSPAASNYDTEAFDSPDLAPFYGLAALARSRMLRDVFESGRFDPLFAAAFENLPLAMRARAIDLTDFSFARLEAAFASCDPAASAEEALLGPGFFARAEERTTANLAEAQANPANGTRIGQALLVAARGRDAARALLADARTLALDVDRFAPSVPFIAPLRRDDEAAGSQELPPFLSALALASRLGARVPGQMRRFRDAIGRSLERAAAPGVLPEDGIGVCTRIGYPLFAAHLLLWEVLLRSREE